MEKEKKVIKVLTAFFISHKSDVKTFLKWILNQCRTALVNMTHIYIIYAPLYKANDFHPHVAMGFN